MKKGSLVILRPSVTVELYIQTRVNEGMLMPSFKEVYTLATDIELGRCLDCGEIHSLVSLAEIPDKTYHALLFQEVQSPEDIDVVALLE